MLMDLFLLFKNIFVQEIMCECIPCRVNQPGFRKLESVSVIIHDYGFIDQLLADEKLDNSRKRTYYGYLWNIGVIFTYPLWSIFALDKTLTNLIILVLVLPLFYAFFILFFFLRNQINTFYFGAISKFEDKNVNFTLLTQQYWWILWSHAYDVTPRYTPKHKFIPENFWKSHKYPNPLLTLSTFRHIFLMQDRPNYLMLSFYFFVFTFLYLHQDLTIAASFILSVFLLFLTKIKLANNRWTLGYHYHWHIIYGLRWNSLTWNEFYENFHLRLWVSFYPLFFSFLLFIFSTILLGLLYIDFFFNPILIWNGYFSKLVLTFFFSTSQYLFVWSPSLTFDYFFALDGLNIWLIWLTSLLVLLCSVYLLETVKIHDYVAQLGWIFLLCFASFQFFCVPNYLWMYIYFELSLLPIFILIIFWGSNRRKIHAAYQMVLFTFIGSVFLLAAILLLYVRIGSFNTFDIFAVTQSNHFTAPFSEFEKKIIWLFLFIGFAVKTPLYPFHIWLPEAHSEAPTTGSVMLAGVLLKMGTYGFLWFVIPLFPHLLEIFKTLVFSMCILGILFSSLAALAQIDVKKIIAYSSIGHMGLVIIGIYTLNMNGLLGASYMMLSHGLISSAMFFSIGLLYKIYGTRSIIYYSSIAHFMPRFSMCFFVFSLANMSFPGTAGFPGEILIFAGMMQDNLFISFLVAIGSIFGGVYSIWLLTRILYGQISPKISTYRDLKPSERKILNFLLLLVFGFGLFPFLIFDFLKPMCIFFTNVIHV